MRKDEERGREGWKGESKEDEWCAVKDKERNGREGREWREGER